MSPQTQTTQRTKLTSWSFAQRPSPSFPELRPDSPECTPAPTTRFPTSVHVELLAAGRIPDPFTDLNEADVQWINEADWTFCTTFAAPPLKAHTDLVFDGLDTYCTVLLNGAEILQCTNMFISHRVPVTLLAENTLELRFAAPLLAARAEEAAHGGPRTLWNGDSSRLYARKAQYGWGWDWGPVVMTVGPWKDVVVETYDYRIDNLRVDADVRRRDANGLNGHGHADDVLGNPADGVYDDCVLAVAGFDVLPAPPAGYKAVYTLTDSDGAVVKQQTADPGHLPHWDLGREVEAWYPIHYGAQPLYALEVALLDSSGTRLAAASQRVAFRHVEIVQEPLSEENGGGSTFLFEVNGIRIFCGGSNWIPADSYLTEVTVERYRAWVELLIRGNQNMLRVWGGGVYEAEALYDICDERGVLVWQDFMFGCGLYPSYPALNDSVKLEAEQAVARLRAHPSVVIFAGNNEDYQVAESQGVVDYDDHSGDYMHTKFPARHIYEILLPEVVHRLSNIFYWPSSPYGGKSSGDLTAGDVHQWNVWHGTQEPWANWDVLAGRFVSEFGMQGYPDLRTVHAWFSDSERRTQCFPQSRISVAHNKADGFERRLELYLMENFRHAFDMPSYVYYTQAMQAETLGAAYRLWRRNWRGRGKELTAGALVWQINDCWPCVSWAICDYYLRPKPAFFAIARELRPYTVGMARKEVTTRREGSLAFYTIRHVLELWACNATLETKSAVIELVAWDLEAGEVKVDRRALPVTLAPNASTEVWSGDVPGQPVRTSTAEVPRPVVVQARLVDADGTVLARYANWPEPWKFLTFPDPGLDISVAGEQVTVTVKKPVKGLVLDAEVECQWSDQAIDMFPGDTQVVTASGLGGRKVTARYIGDGSA